MTAASPPAVDGRVAKLAEDLSRVREELVEARQREELRSAEVSALQERVQAAEERAAERVGQAEQQEARLREVSALRDRVQRVEKSSRPKSDRHRLPSARQPARNTPAPRRQTRVCEMPGHSHRATGKACNSLAPKHLRQSAACADFALWPRLQCRARFWRRPY